VEEVKRWRYETPRQSQGLCAFNIRVTLSQSSRVFDKVDLFLAPCFTGRSMLLSNLTGHPCVVLPDGFSRDGTPTSICFIGKLFGEAELLAVAKAYQGATEFHRKHPTVVMGLLITLYCLVHATGFVAA